MCNQIIWFFIIIVLVIIIGISFSKTSFIIGGSEHKHTLLLYMKRGATASLQNHIKKECPNCKIVKINSVEDIKKHKTNEPVVVMSEGQLSDHVRAYQRDNPLDIRGIILINPACNATELDNYNPKNIIVHSTNPTATQERCFHHLIRNISNESIASSVSNMMPQ